MNYRKSNKILKTFLSLNIFYFTYYRVFFSVLNRKLTAIKSSKKLTEQNELSFNDLIAKYEHEKFELDELNSQLEAEEKYPLFVFIINLQSYS